MKKIKKYIILFLLLVTPAIKSQTIEFKGDAPAAVIAGEKFRLTYTVNKTGSDFRLPPIDNFQVLMGPSTSQSQSWSTINGKTEQKLEFAYTYILKCDNPGKYHLGPATIVVDGNKVESNSLTIDVVKGDDSDSQQQSKSSSSVQDNSGLSNDDLFVTVTANKASAYKDEPLVLTTKLYVRPQINVQGISDQKIPDLKGFISQDLPSKNNQQYETVNGTTYVTLILQQKLVFPQKSGKLTVDPSEIEFIIKQRVARRSQSIFDDFFESNYRTIKRRVTSKPLSINVKPLPGNVPSDFSGIVGSVNMNMSVSKTDVKTNDGITLKLNVTGIGNHKLMSTPELKVPADFDRFDPKVSNNFSNTFKGMEGNKTFEYLIIPRHSGEFVIPPITFSYFDINSKTYKQLATKEVKINVEKGNMEEMPSSSTTPYSASREELKYIGKDIRYIKTEPIHLKPAGLFLLGSRLFYLLLLIPFAIFLVIIIVARKRIKEGANVQLMRNKKANKLAQKRLKQAHILLKKNEKEAFYDEVLRALWGYMSDKLTLPVAKLSKENASTLMANFEVPDTTISKFMEILDTCEFARYAPSSGSAEMDTLYNETIDTIMLLEGQIKK